MNMAVYLEESIITTKQMGESDAHKIPCVGHYHYFIDEDMGSSDNSKGFSKLIHHG